MRNVWLISVAFFFIFFGFGTAQQYLVVLFNQDGRGQLALLSLLLLYSAFMITGVFVSKLVPFFGGLKRSLIIATFTYALFTASIAFNNAPFLLIASVVCGIGAGLLWTASTQIIADSSARRAGRNFALQTAFQNAGNVAGIFVGGYLVGAVSLSTMYLIFAAATLMGPALLLGLRPTREELEHRPFKPFFMFDLRMLALFPLIFGATYLAGQAITAMNVVIVASLGIGAIPFVTSIFRIGNIAGSLSIGAIADRLSKPFLIVVLIGMGLLGVLFFTKSTAEWPLITGTVLIGIALAALVPISLALLKERLHTEEYLYAFGIVYVYTNLGIVIAIISNIYLSSRESFIPGAIAFMLAIPGVFLFEFLTKK